jgi:hypothetical protein
VQELPRLGVELRVELRGVEDHGRELGAAGRGAVEREVHAGVVEGRPDDLVLEVVEADGLAIEGEARGDEELEPRVDDARDVRVAVQHVEERERVVRVDVVGEPRLPGREEVRARPRPGGADQRDEAVEPSAVRLEARVVDAALAVDARGEDRGPVGVVEAGRGGERGLVELGRRRDRAAGGPEGPAEAEAGEDEEEEEAPHTGSTEQRGQP